MNEEYVVDNVEANEKLEAEIVQEENQQDKKPITEYAFNNKIVDCNNKLNIDN